MATKALSHFIYLERDYEHTKPLCSLRKLSQILNHPVIATSSATRDMTPIIVLCLPYYLGPFGKIPQLCTLAL